jgi:hypothetical protein
LPTTIRTPLPDGVAVPLRSEVDAVRCWAEWVDADVQAGTKVLADQSIAAMLRGPLRGVEDTTPTYGVPVSAAGLT